MRRPQFTLKTLLFKIDVRDLFKTEGRLVDEALLDELTAIILNSGVDMRSAHRVVEQVRGELNGRVVELPGMLLSVERHLKALLDQAPRPGTQG